MAVVNYVGIDVDTKGFSTAVFVPETGEVIEKRLRPGQKHLTEWLQKIPGKKRLCYEAGYLGFSLQRSLKKAGYECEVVAPSLIPEVRGERVKTDRLDALKLAKYLAAGLLTAVAVPDEEDEATRSLVRSRHFAMRQLVQLKNRITGFCRARGWDFKEEKNQKCYWTSLHETWLREKLLAPGPGQFALNLELLLEQKKQLTEIIKKYDAAIESISLSERYQKPHQALTCYRGIDTMTAMSLVTELGDIARFESPRQIASYVGLDITEYSSGGSHNRSGITRLGNAYLRWALIESVQYGLYKPNVSKGLRKRREGVDQNFVTIADRSMERLHRKGSRLLYAGKHKNKIKVAMARELIGFIWESLRETRGMNKRSFIKGTVQIKKPTDSPR